jgi:hypothetical protein
MLDRGLTEEGAAQALGWPKNRITARVKILELPERAQQLIGEHVIPWPPSSSCARSARSRPTCSTPSSPSSTTATPGRPSD